MTAALSLLAACWIINLCYKAKTSKIAQSGGPTSKPFGSDADFDISEDDIKKLPKDLLDKISSRLEMQYQDLGSAEGKNINSEAMVLEDSTTIKIDMEKEIVSEWVGRKATVVITPENQQIIQAVATYFKKKVYNNQNQENLFNEVRINGKSLALKKCTLIF